MISGGMIDRRASETSRERKTSVLTPIVFELRCKVSPSSNENSVYNIRGGEFLIINY